jgi:hypothetical protein
MRTRARIAVLSLFVAISLCSCGSCGGTYTPPSAPGSPQDLSITTGSTGDTLSWSSVSDADSYNVYFSAAGLSYSKYSSTTGTSWLLPFYGYYKVSAENDVGEGTLSSACYREKPAENVVETPIFSPTAGNFTNDVDEDITITCTTADSIIYYTTDGTTPIIGGSPEYSTPITVSTGTTVTITAIAVASGYSNSDAAQGTFHNVGWQLVGDVGFSDGEVSYVSIAVNSEGTPYVAYRDASTTKATVKYYDGSSWITLGGTGLSSGSAFHISMAIDDADAVYVAYYDGDKSGMATVCRFAYSEGAWTTVGSAGFSAGVALYLSLALNSTGIPYLAYLDGSDSLYRATVQYRSGTSWLTLGSTRPSTGMVSGTSLAISEDGIPYLAYIDNNLSDMATVTKYYGNTWTDVGDTVFSSGSVESISLALDSAGMPYVAYKDNGTTANGKISVRQFNGSSWIYLGMEGLSSDTVDNVSLAIFGDGTLFVAYKDNNTIAAGKPTVQQYDEDMGTWISVGTEGFGTETVLDYLDLAIDADGIPFVAFKDGTADNKATVMVYR